MEHIYDMLIIGGGPGGYTAALYGARGGLDVLLLEKMAPGGQMALTHMIDNYPGFDEGIDGFTLGEKMRAGAERFGAKTVLTEVLSADLTGEIKSVSTPDGTFYGRTAVISAGANPRKLGLPGEDDHLGRGIHYCAACDGMFYRGKTVIVVGGGNTAAADALLLSRVAERVILVHRRDTLRAEKIVRDAITSAENVEFRWNSTLSHITENADGKLTGAVLRDVKTGEESSLTADGIFVSIGRSPASELFRNQVTLDESGYIMADESTRTNLDGVYAVGDIRTKAVRQIVTAVSDGAAAVHFAEEYIG
jgi:thioredoxin reductase (NADPH)